MGFIGMFLRQENSNTVKSIKELANAFDDWMRRYDHPKRSDAEHLLAWLYNERSKAKDVKDYKQFCELAKEIAVKGYKTDSLIPESDFNRAKEKAKTNEMWKRNFKFHSFHGSKGRIAQDAGTVALLDAIEGYQRPGGAQDLYESDLVKPEDFFKPGFGK
jgi:hypothetical protein